MATSHDVSPALADEALDLTGLDPELVDIFVEEGGDLLDHSDGLLAQLRETPEDREMIVGLQRDLHTLKGGARMAGIMAVGELGHAMESLLEAVVDSAANWVAMACAAGARLRPPARNDHPRRSRAAARMPSG